jgi:hypothetical protein
MDKKNYFSSNLNIKIRGLASLLWYTMLGINPIIFLGRI